MRVDTYIKRTNERSFHRKPGRKNHAKQDMVERNLSFYLCCSDVEGRRIPNIENREWLVSFFFWDVDILEILELKSRSLKPDYELSSHLEFHPKGCYI